MASTRATNTALTRLPACLSRTVPRAVGQRRLGSWMFASASKRTIGATAGMGAWRDSGVGARRWNSGRPEKTPEEERQAAAKGELGFDEVKAIVTIAEKSRERMRRYLTDPRQPPILIDVRSPAEYAAGSIPAAVNMPVNSHMDALFASPDDFEDRMGFPKPSERRQLVFYCKAGVRSHAAAELAKQAGFTNVKEYPGSWLDWERRGGEVVKDQNLLKEE